MRKCFKKTRELYLMRTEHLEEPLIKLKIGPQKEEITFLVDTEATRSTFGRYPPLSGDHKAERPWPVLGAKVRAKVEGLSGDPDAGARLAVSDVQLVPSRVPASDPVGSTGQDRAGAAASSEGLQAFPVLQGATHNTYQPLAWQALTELRDVVRKYGLGSAEVMQVLRSFNASLLTPFDIRSLARALFPPVEYDFFENKWTQLAVRAVERNTTLGPGDPRRMVNIDMLMGTGNYTRAEGQAGYEPLVQEQCQQTGMAALVQTLQLATPQQPFATIVQGIDEPFLCFAGRLTAAVEKQVSDPAARKLMIQSVAQGNCNAACKRIIEALPGEPSMSDMVGACAKISPSSQQVLAVHTAVQPAVATIVQPTVVRHSGPADRACGRANRLWLLLCSLLGSFPRGCNSSSGVLGPGKKKRRKSRPPQVRWTAVLTTKDHPETLCTVSMVGATPSEIHLRGLLDTGADVSILSLAAWPPGVPFEPSKDIDRRLRRNEAMLPHALSGVRKQFPDARVYHYMDDILVATPTQDELLRIQPQLLNALHSHGLQVAPEKEAGARLWEPVALHLDSARHVP
ncbi:hypothetical protein DUI87_27405 [Hirundo rustica rustica]|uniref:ribonuclease H n=1 Tax=Hirundo rustica rustica TaxID=333673 RepID=A0A3M0JBE0_HIRRU|nr:hypothetical protein DUI87_27405 [Hirundo rustica rustica]